MKALVTGGGGFLGLYIVEQLVQRGDDIRVLCRHRHAPLETLPVEVRQGDVRDEATVRRAVEGCEAVFHVAAVPGVWGPYRHYYETNTRGTEHLIEAALDAGTKRLIYTSSPSVVFDGQSHENEDESLPYPQRYLCAYPETKALAERAVLAANGRGGLATVALRPHLIWGPRDTQLLPRLIEKAAAGRIRQVGDGTNQVTVAYVENAAAAHLQACDALSGPTAACAGKAYFINDVEPVGLWDWVNHLLQIAGQPPIRKAISARAAYQLGTALELVYRTLRLKGEPPMTRFVALQLSQSHTYRVDAARCDFGYREIVDREEGLRRLAADLEARRNAM